MYGTAKEQIFQIQGEGKIPLLDIDVQGSIKFSEAFPDSNFVAVLPPSIEELRSRLEKRGTETQEKINTRVGNAQGEMDIIMGKPDVFQYRLTNDNLDEACQVLHNLVGSLYTTELGGAAQDVV